MGTLFSFLWSFILSLIGAEKKTTMEDVYKKDANIEEKQLEIVMDRNRPDATERMSDHTF